MLTVIDRDLSEPLINYKVFEQYEEVNGPLTLAFTSIDTKNNPGHALLKGEVLVETEEGRQFRVKQMGGSTYRKQINATSIYFDLKGTQKYDIFGGTKTLNEFLAWILEGSGWTFENVNVTGSRLIENFGKADALKLIEILLSEFECEREILPGKHLRFEKQLGPDNDAQYRLGHNIRAISINEDTTNYGTVIRGYGADGLTVTYRSPKADIVGEFHAEPFTDERFTVPENLLERIKKELRDEPEVAYELDAYELTEKELGERVWLIHEILGIEFNTRVLAKTTRIPKEKSTVVIGTTKTATATDQLAEQDVKIDENQKQNQSRFEQTNEKFTLEVERLDGDIVEAYSYVNQTADNIRSEVGAIKIELEDGIADSISYIDQTAQSIQSGVDTQIIYLDGRVSAAESLVTQTANTIRSEIADEVTYLDGRVDSFNSSITQLSNAINTKASAESVTSLGTQMNTVEQSLDAVSGTISTKVSMSDITGEVIASKINQSASTVKIDAKNIELSGITTVAKTLRLGDAGDTTQERSIIFSNYSAIETNGTSSMEIAAHGSIYLNADEVRFDSLVTGGTGAKVDFSTASSIDWGTHAPDTTARFG